MAKVPHEADGPPFVVDADGGLEDSFFRVEHGAGEWSHATKLEHTGLLIVRVTHTRLVREVLHRCLGAKG